MNLVRKHIASLLFVVFFFPITFQSLHILWHHSHGYKSEHHVCHQNLYEIDSNTININIAEREKTCPICEYQFSILDLPEIAFLSSIIPVFSRILKEEAKQQQYKQVFSDRTPRAPPVLFS